MLTTEIQQDTHSGPVTLNPRWLRIPAAVKYSGLSRSRLYELLSERKIRSICLKSHKGAERGVRLLDRESIDTFMLTLQSSQNVTDGSVQPFERTLGTSTNIKVSSLPFNITAPGTYVLTGNLSYTSGSSFGAINISGPIERPWLSI